MAWVTNFRHWIINYLGGIPESDVLDRISSVEREYSQREKYFNEQVSDVDETNHILQENLVRLRGEKNILISKVNGLERKLQIIGNVRGERDELRGKVSDLNEQQKRLLAYQSYLQSIYNLLNNGVNLVRGGLMVAGVKNEEVLVYYANDFALEKLVLTKQKGNNDYWEIPIPYSKLRGTRPPFELDAKLIDSVCCSGDVEIKDLFIPSKKLDSKGNEFPVKRVFNLRAVKFGEYCLDENVSNLTIVYLDNRDTKKINWMFGKRIHHLKGNIGEGELAVIWQTAYKQVIRGKTSNVRVDMAAVTQISPDALEKMKKWGFVDVVNVPKDEEVFKLLEDYNIIQRGKRTEREKGLGFSPA